MAVQCQSFGGEATGGQSFGGRCPLTEADVLVIGGGIAGLATAIELALAGIGTVVVEAAGEPAERFGETLAPGVLARLDRLGLSEAFRSAGHLSCPGTVVRWGSDRTEHNDFVLDPLGPAWHIDRSRFELMLRERAVQVGVVARPATRVVALERSGSRTTASLTGASGARSVSAQWLVDASGPSAWLARRHDVRRVVVDRLVALVRIADLADGAFTAQTVVESTPDGWWYAARIPGDRLVTVFVTEPGSVRALTAGHWTGWHRALGATGLLADLLAGAELSGEQDQAFRVRSIGVSQLARPTGEHWLAVGDAAAQLDPIAGRGIDEALADARQAARVLTDAIGGGRSTISEYCDHVHARFTGHLAERAAWHDAERRWAAEPFWRIRVGSVPRRAGAAGGRPRPASRTPTDRR